MKLRMLYDRCYKEIGGKKNKDIRWYLHKRPKTITRDSFFEAAITAIWVSGLKRTSVDSFLSKASDFVWDFRKVVRKTTKEWQAFKKAMHGRSVPAVANRKWEAVRAVAKQLSKYKNDKQFQLELFDGKVRSSRLDNRDVEKLRQQKLPYIGPANSHFVIRNMGGEAIKCDRWLAVFMKHYRTSEAQLLKRLKRLSIPSGLFDLVIWAYCEMFVKKTRGFSMHFNKAFK
jgi:hypothetical protein